MSLSTFDSTKTDDASSSSVLKPSITIKGTHLKTVQQLHALAINVIPLLGTIVAIALSFQLGISLIDIGLLFSLYALTFIGITVGFHRHFAHHAFRTINLIRFVLIILGSMACQGPLPYWVSNHRRHHQYSDQPGDPHSPHFKNDEKFHGLSGLWHSHIDWMFSHDITNTFIFAKDLLQDSAVLRVSQLYYLWAVLGLIIPAFCGGVLSGTWIGALSGFLWGGLVRLFLTLHATSSVNSITHLFGSRPYNTSEQSRNNIWFAVPTLGEAWHNNHHAFPNSALFGLEWWQVDLGAWVIKLFEFSGLAWDVKSPTQAQKIAKVS
jgi:stearoyl-CoA desaturase (Delta-9 desaturase)